VERKERLVKINRVLILTMFLNLFVCLLKVVLGLVTGSLTIMADGLHSLGDTLSNIVGMVGIKLAQKQPDKKYPYGYEKFEAVATLIIAGLISITFFEVMKSGIERLLNPQVVEISPLVLLLMAVSVGVNIFVVWYESRASKRHRSELLHADASESRTDIYISIGVMIGIFFMYQGMYWLDGVITIIVGLFILKVIIDIIISTVKVLADGQIIDPEEVEKIVLSVPGARFCHSIRSRGREDAFYIDLHLGVDPNISVEEAHDEICHSVKLALEEHYSTLKSAQVHIEPDNESGRHRSRSVFAKNES